MAYTDDSVRAKLSSLNETQDSVVTVGQWIMFHKRHADKTVNLWLQKLKDSGAQKRLFLLYLANEVVQQSKARRKDEFLAAFSPIIAEATSVAYKGTTQEFQHRLRRVVEVWRARNIFEAAVQDDVEARINELDKSRPQATRSLLGGTLFSTDSSASGAPFELQPLITLQVVQTKASVAVKPAMTNATTEYEKLMDSSQPAPSPPVHAARLSALLKSLATAESAVSESVKTRKALIDGLESILVKNRKALSSEEAQLDDASSRRQTTEIKKREVEDAIMRGMTADESTTPIDSPNHAAGGAVLNSTSNGYDDGPGLFAPSFNDHDNDGDDNIARPAMEPLTPPTIDDHGLEDIATSSFIVDSPVVDEGYRASSSSEARARPQPDPRLKRRAEVNGEVTPIGNGSMSGGANGVSSSAKRRKSSHEEEFDALELDEDVVGMLG